MPAIWIDAVVSKHNRDQVGTQTEFKTKAPADRAGAFSITSCCLTLERQREGDTVSPVARAVTISVSITVVVIQTVSVREHAEIVADLVPIVRNVSVESR